MCSRREQSNDNEKKKIIIMKQTRYKNAVVMMRRDQVTEVPLVVVEWNQIERKITNDYLRHVPTGRKRTRVRMHEWRSSAAGTLLQPGIALVKSDANPARMRTHNRAWLTCNRRRRCLAATPCAPSPPRPQPEHPAVYRLMLYSVGPC